MYTHMNSMVFKGTFPAIYTYITTVFLRKVILRAIIILVFCLRKLIKKDNTIILSNTNLFLFINKLN